MEPDISTLHKPDILTLQRHQKASEAFLEGSKRPGAALWMKIMAAKVAEEGPSRATSMFLWRQIYDSSADPLIRKSALTHMKLLKAEQDREKLNEFVIQFVERFKRFPRDLDELASAGMLRGSLADPEGFPYVLGPDGKTQLHPKSPLAAEQGAGAPSK